MQSFDKVQGKLRLNDRYTNLSTILPHILLILTKTPVCGCRMYRGNVHVLKENAVVFSNGSVIPQVNIKNEYTCKHRKRVMSITYLCYMGSGVK